MTQRSLGPRVAAAAQRTLAMRKYATPLDVCVAIGWLCTAQADSWRQGRIGSLEEVLPVDAAKLAGMLSHVESWAAGKGLKRDAASYIAATRDRRELRFTADGAPGAERAWRAQWTSPELTGKQAERIASRQPAAPDLVVVQPAKEFTCGECGTVAADLLIMDGKGPFCMACADRDHLVFLPSGNAVLTRRSKKKSRLSAVVVRWSKPRKRYERQGLLVEEPALEEAERACLADEDDARFSPRRGQGPDKAVIDRVLAAWS